MKTLLILRHGKAQPDAPHGDKARVLVSRGEREAALMGQLIAKLALNLDGVASSDAARARQTAEIAAPAAGFTGAIRYEPAIYAAELDDLLDVVRKLPDEWGCVLLVGHNPGFEDLSAALAKEGTEPPVLPTAGMVHIVFESATRWKEVREGSGRLVAVYKPKDFRVAQS